MALPTSWTDALDRLARTLGDGAERRQEVGEWLRQAVKEAYGVESLHELGRDRRAVAFQRTCGVVLAAEDTGWPDEVVDGATGRLTLWYRDGSIDFDPDPGDLVPRRDRVARIFSRYFGGAALAGPDWRVSPLEAERPSYGEWASTSDFGSDG